MLLLSSLPNSWETLVVFLSNCVLDEVVTMSQVTSCMLNDETRRKSMNSLHSETLVIERQGEIKVESSNTVINQKKRLSQER